MRLLIACTNCQRRYNAAERKIGTRFRCHCGEILEVQQPKGHHASVVRCSSCGSAREKGANSCSYCDADFTLHERDLNTVCSSCFSRVSDKAKYCSHCAAVLSAESMAGEDTHLLCPACPGDEKLLSRRLGHEKISVLECQKCTGLWLGTESFRQLKQRVARGVVNLSGALARKPIPKTLKKQQGPLYRNCVRCSTMMARKQYAPGSGIVIDFCRDHGIWFDSEELHQILDWISKGGQPTDPAAKLTQEQIFGSLDSGKKKKRVIGRWSPETSAFPYSGTSILGEIVFGLFGGMNDLFD